MKFSASSSRTYPAREAGCALETFSTAPQKAYEELGTFDVSYPSRHQEPESAGDFKDMLASRACALGADALILFAEGATSVYSRAVAIKWTAPTAPTAPSDEDDAPPAGAE